MRLRGSHLSRLAVGVALLGLLMAGCGKNSPTTVLTPTGFRPGPAVPTGSLFGFVVYDPTNTPDINVAPFPSTIIQLLKNGVPVKADTLSIDSTRFHFEGVAPGTYSVSVTASSFLINFKSNLKVRETRVDAGNITVALDNSFLNTINCYLTGDIPGFGLDQVGTYESGLDQNALGIWTYPNVVYTGGAPIPAGTYRFKLITDISSTLTNLVGWGGSQADTLTVPFSGRRVVRASGPATDLIARFPTTAVYQITLDERRQSLSIVPAPTAGALRLMRIHR